MTREELKDWANDAWACCTMDEGERFVLGLRRATLNEAARAVCSRCRNDGFPERDDQSNDYWHAPGPYGSILCDASAIHDLIAALDKEVKP